MDPNENRIKILKEDINKLDKTNVELSLELIEAKKQIEKLKKNYV